MHSKYWLNNNNRQVYIMQLSRRFAMTALSAAVLTAVYAPQVTANEGISDNEIRIGYLADMSVDSFAGSIDRGGPISLLGLADSKWQDTGVY